MRNIWGHDSFFLHQSSKTILYGKTGRQYDHQHIFYAAIRYTGIPYVIYYTTKAEILGLTQSIAIQYAVKNIRANAILPGLMHPSMFAEPFKETYVAGGMEKMFEISNKQCPTGKMGDTWNVAYAALVYKSLAMAESLINLSKSKEVLPGTSP